MEKEMEYMLIGFTIFLGFIIVGIIGLSFLQLDVGVFISMLLGSGALGFSIFTFLSSKLFSNESSKRQRAFDIEPQLFFQMRVEDLQSEELKKLSKKKVAFINMVKNKYNMRLTKQKYKNLGKGILNNWRTSYKFYIKNKPIKIMNIKTIIPIYTPYIEPGGENIQIETMVFQDDIFEKYNSCIVRTKFQDIDENRFCQCQLFINMKKNRLHTSLGKFQRRNKLIISLPVSISNKPKCDVCLYKEFWKISHDQ